MPLFADRYEMGPVIGYGGMAEVRGARDTRLERPVAIKIMRSEVAHQPLVRERFESEARMAARLMHPNVVSIFDSGEEQGLPYIVMERLPGDTLHDRLANGPMPESEVRQLAGEILAALGTAHAAGILHRDIKPANVLASGDGHWKVADFGIAKALEVSGGDATATGLVLGTPAYLAPERLYGAPATVASDLYSLGVVLYESLTGRRPYESGPPGASQGQAPTPAGNWPAVVTGAPLVPLSTIRPGVDPRLAAAIERSLAREPSERFWSAAEMAAAVSGVAGVAGPTEVAAGGMPTTVMSPGPATDVLPVGGAAETAAYRPAPGGGPYAAPRRNPAAPALALLAGAAILAAIIIAAVGLGGKSHGGSPATSHTTAVPTTGAVSTTATTVPPSTTTSSSTSSTTTSSTTSTTTSTTLLPVTLPPAPGPAPGPAKHHH